MTILAVVFGVLVALIAMGCGALVAGAHPIGELEVSLSDGQKGGAVLRIEDNPRLRNASYGLCEVLVAT